MEGRDQFDHLDAGVHNPMLPAPPTEGQVVPNEFSTRKTATNAMMDAALFMANISQLRLLLSGDRDLSQFFVPLLCLISFSIACQVLFAVLILVIWARDTRLTKKAARQPPPCTPPPHSCPAVTCTATDHKNGCKPPPTSEPFARSDSASSRRSLQQNNGVSSSVIISGMTAAMQDRGCDITPEDHDVAYDAITQYIHMTTLVLVFLITVANMFITGLGFEPGQSPAPGKAVS